MATSTSPLPPLSPSFAAAHFQWPHPHPQPHSHSHSRYFQPPSFDEHQYYQQEQQAASFELPELSSSFGLLSHTATDLPSPESPDASAEADRGTASLYAGAFHFPSQSSLSSSLSTQSSSSSSSAYSSTPSPPAVSGLTYQLFMQAQSATADRQHSGSRRRRRRAEDADEMQEADEVTADELPLPPQHYQHQHHQAHPSHHYTSARAAAPPQPYFYPEPEADFDADDSAARRLKHRQIDAARRAREQAAIVRLQQLTQHLTHIPHFDQQHATPAKRRRAAEPNYRKDKVSVLEEAADRMEAMYALIEQLGSACMAQYDHSRATAYQQRPFSVDVNTGDAHIISLLPTRTASSVLSAPAAHSAHPPPLSSHHQPAALTAAAATAVRQSLFTSFFLSASLPMLTVHCETGQVLDVNSKALEMSGWQPHHMIGKRITAPYELIMSKSLLSYSESMKEEVDCMDSAGRVLVEEKDGQMVHARVHPQYETSNELERRLYAGEVSVIQAVWRLQLRNGRLHEVTATQWCDGWVDVPDSANGVKRRPTYVVYVISPESTVRLD